MAQDVADIDISASCFCRLTSHNAGDSSECCEEDEPGAAGKEKGQHANL
jgi:hypothetical protein